MIGARIKSLRQAKGYSQEFLATQLKITQASMSRIESDIITCDIKKLKQIAKLFNISIDELMGEEK